WLGVEQRKKGGAARRSGDGRAGTRRIRAPDGRRDDGARTLTTRVARHNVGARESTDFREDVGPQPAEVPVRRRSRSPGADPSHEYINGCAPINLMGKIGTPGVRIGSPGSTFTGGSEMSGLTNGDAASDAADGHRDQQPPWQQPTGEEPGQEPLPVRMINELVYCPRLFFLMH